MANAAPAMGSPDPDADEDAAANRSSAANDVGADATAIPVAALKILSLFSLPLLPRDITIVVFVSSFSFDEDEDEDARASDCVRRAARVGVGVGGDAVVARITDIAHVFIFFSVSARTSVVINHHALALVRWVDPTVATDDDDRAIHGLKHLGRRVGAGIVKARR
jgi:hypothetical protein